MAYSQDYRQLALQKLEEGYSIRETAEYFEISTRTLQNWKKSLERKRRVFKPLKIDTELLLKTLKTIQMPTNMRGPNVLNVVHRVYVLL